MHWRWGLLGVFAVSFASVASGFACSSSASRVVESAADGGALQTSWVAPNGVVLTLSSAPFGLSVFDRNGNLLLETATPDESLAASDPLRAYEPLSVTHDTDISGPTLTYGWAYFVGANDPWKEAVSVTSLDYDKAHFTAHLATTDPVHPGLTLTATPQDSGLHIVASIDAITGTCPDGGDEAGACDSSPVNRVSLSFKLHDDDHFMGFGERYVYADRRGTMTYDWVEEDGFGHGEQTPLGPTNPSPNGTGMTHVPVPWFMNPRGYGMFLNTTWRTNFHLGEERPDAWRVESTTGALDMSLFVDPDPMNLLASLTAVTGRPPVIADWVLAPRRRGDVGSGEDQKLRANHIPTSAIDTAVHYFPAGDGQDHAAMQAITAQLHAEGYKAVAYFCPFVANSWQPVFDEAAAAGYLVKHADGTPYVVLDPPYAAGMVDFTNPAAVAWYQSFLLQAVADGWDGWMYDFAEYVPQDAVMFDGESGMEAHNEYPVLYQQAALAMFQQAKPDGDFLFFVRSGYAGTGGVVPMVWAGDQATDFDLAQGLPAALTGALNAGMSGLPLWGSDISGYHYLYNPPPDKEVYLRWTEVGAFSADMHDENEGTGTTPSSTRWQIWDDQESTDVYRRYAGIKTRMLPYVRVAVREARATGAPVMRAMYLSYPLDPRVYTMQDEYMYGDSLLVAPVVTRALTARTVYLPEPQYFDYWTGARVVGGGDVTAQAPLDTVPVFARVGAIVPMLSPDVETVFPSSDDSVVSMQDRADFLEVQVFAGGSTSLTLDDGTVLAQTAPTAGFDPGTTITHTGGAVPAAASVADLQTCAACFWNDPADNVVDIAVVTSTDAITAGPMTLSVTQSPTAPTVKRYLFTVRH
jgi:alpha-glucosidase (family GH31 glycosyl hydrolase)